MISWNRMLRTCTRISTSSAVDRPAARAERAPDSEPALDLPRDALGDLARRALASAPRRRFGRPVLGVALVLDLRDRRPQRHRAAGSRRAPSCAAQASTSSMPSRSAASAKTGRPPRAHCRQRAEAVVQRHLRRTRTAPAVRLKHISAARVRRTLPGRRPGTKRSTASGRPPRTACAAASRGALAVRRNRRSAPSITSHCCGLVSCPSSTRMWLMPLSSL